MKKGNLKLISSKKAQDESQGLSSLFIFLVIAALFILGVIIYMFIKSANPFK